MKKLLRALAASVVGAGLMLGAASAADVTCGTTNTGAGSNNQVFCQDTSNNYLTCANNVVVVNGNGQIANSGDAFTISNTNSSGAGSGSASNTNQVNVQVGVTGCSPVASTVSAAPNAPAGGSGAAAPAPAQTAAPKPVALPETGSDSFVKTAAISVAVVGGALAAVQGGLQAYRRFAVK